MEAESRFLCVAEFGVMKEIRTERLLLLCMRLQKAIGENEVQNESCPEMENCEKLSMIIGNNAEALKNLQGKNSFLRKSYNVPGARIYRVWTESQGI